MKRHTSLKAIQAAFLAASALAALALVPWQNAVADHLPPGTIGLAMHNGDLDADGAVAINDAIYLLNYLYSGGRRPKMLACEPFADPHNGDVNATGVIDLTDAIYLLNWLFAEGPPPVEGCPEAGSA